MIDYAADRRTRYAQSPHSFSPRAIHTARAHGLQIMLSCMVETSVGVTAAAHIAPLCDYVDLDGPLLIANDPYRGVRFDGARLILPEAPGLGVTRA